MGFYEDERIRRKNKPVCEYCQGKGYVEVLQNYEANYDGWEEPIYEKEPCEECFTVLEEAKKTTGKSKYKWK